MVYVDTSVATPEAGAMADGKTPTRPIRVPPPVWERFGATCERLGTDRSTLLREVMRICGDEPELLVDFASECRTLGVEPGAWLRDAMRWCTRDPEVRQPKRPAPPREASAE